MLCLKKLSLCCLLPLASLLASAAVVAQSDRGTLPASVAAALDTAKIPADALSLAVIPLEGQGVAQFVNADRPVNPASTMKLVTTYAALELLGPHYQWLTDLYATGPVSKGVLEGDLVFRSSGDPKLTMERIWLLLRDLRAAGVREVAGNLIMQPADLRLPTDLPGFQDDGNDQSRPFLVEPDPLLTNLKLLSLRSYGEAGGIRTYLEPALPEVSIDNQLTLLPATGNCPWPDISYAVQDDGKRASITLTGKLHAGCHAEHYLSVLDAPVYTASLIRTLWHEMGGSIRGGNFIGPAPRDSRLLARSTSPDLVSVVRDINKYSNNAMARQLFLTLGRELRSATDADDHKAATRIINQWLADKDIRPSGLVLENGSGLSRMERMSARDLSVLLSHAWRSPYSAEFVASMPLAALDGTMRRRLHDTPLAGQAHIKTGALRNVRAIAGITRDHNGQNWAVTAIVNHQAAGASRTALDQLLTDVHRRGPTEVADSR